MLLLFVVAFAITLCCLLFILFAFLFVLDFSVCVFGCVLFWFVVCLFIELVCVCVCVCVFTFWSNKTTPLGGLQFVCFFM